MNTVSGLVKILLGVATLGLVPAFFPKFVCWMPPPVSEQMRRSKQRRVIPEGYPCLSDSNSEKEEKEQKKSSEKLAASFSWYERLYLFWTTPIVIFVFDKINSLCITLMFTIWFVAHRQAVSSGQHRISIMPLELSPDLDVEPLQGVEIYLCIYFACSCARELTEILCEIAADAGNAGLHLIVKHYFFNFWNVLDMGEILAFFVGIGFRVQCEGSSCMSARRKGDGQGGGDGVGADAQEYTSGMWSTWSIAYGICLFFSWFRVLKFFMLTKLGLLVAVFYAMLRDVSIFVIIYTILLVACTMLFIGIAPPEVLNPRCGVGSCTCDDDLGDGGHMQCKASYILIRTLFQSFGDISTYLPEMTSSPAIIFLIFIFVLLNVVLMNLLIALMSSTYNSVLNQAKANRLLDKYALVRDASYICFSVPAPFNIIALISELCIFVAYKKKVDDKFPDCTPGRKLELFLRRNTQPWAWNATEHDDTVYENRSRLPAAHAESQLALSACMVLTHRHTHTHAHTKLYIRMPVYVYVFIQEQARSKVLNASSTKLENGDGWAMA
jgi:hypothetical protein